ncbi:MAG: type III polyketide synthase [Planctomycetota bacterium]|jgi:predicted naringenin-chalcone synthase
MTGRRPRLLGLGRALPALRLDPAAVERTLADAWGLEGARRRRWARMVAGTGIERRFGVAPPARILDLTTAGRMALYERAAPPLAAEAAANALRAAGVTAADVTDVVVVSCTGFSAPGLDAALVPRLGLAPTVRRTVVGFMGCFGGITGLRTAAGLCSADPRGVALVVCVELCSLHARRCAGADNQVASALFADGAAAAVVAGPDAGGPAGLARIGPGHTRLLPEGRDWMTWRITDAGFAMTLAPRIPALLEERVRGFVDVVGAGPRAACVVHPGGPAIVDAVERGLGSPGPVAFEAARRVLRRHGNMSSATILFVLDEALRDGVRPPLVLLAFGPGLTLEALPLTPVAAPPKAGSDNTRTNLRPQTCGLEVPASR